MPFKIRSMTSHKDAYNNRKLHVPEGNNPVKLNSTKIYLLSLYTQVIGHVCPSTHKTKFLMFFISLF